MNPTSVPGRRPHPAFTGLALALLALAVALPRLAAQPAPHPPERMTYQGFLVDGNGVALGHTAPKNYDVIFRIYDDQEAGSLLWAEQQTLTVDKGYFSVLLGEGAAVGSEPRPALSLLFKGATASERFVGITVKGIGPGGANVDILPRLRLMSSPYAFLAEQAVKLVQDTGADLISASGNTVTVGGPVTAPSFSGDGANLTALNASALNAGVVNDALLSPTIARRLGGNFFQGDQVLMDGNIWVGNRVNTNVVGAGYGKSVILSGGPDVSGSFNNLNSDPLWLARYNIAENQTELRINLGDDPGSSGDRLVVGTTSGADFNQTGAWTPLAILDARGFLGLGGVVPTSLLTFPNSLANTKISLWDSGNGNGYGLGLGNGQLRFHVDAPTAKFSFLNGAAGSEVLTIRGTGWTGIGATNPTAPLHILSTTSWINIERTPGMTAQFGRDNTRAWVALNQSFNNADWRYATYDGDSNWDFSSDRNLKRDIEDAEPMLDRALQVKVRRYRWKNDEPDATHKLGVVAQEVQPLFPEMVGHFNNPQTQEESLTVGYGDFAVIAIKALQEFKAQHDADLAELKARMTELARENRELRSRLDHAAKVAPAR